MNSKILIWVGLSIGSAIGGYIPTLWGAGVFSLWSVILSAVGGAFGIYLGFKMSQY